MDERYLTVGEIAELLKVNQMTVRNWIDRGELIAVRPGGRRVRVRQSDLDRFLEVSTARGERYQVLTLEKNGVRLEYRRTTGPFASKADAEAWIDEQGLTDDSTGLLGVVYPMRS